MRCPESGCDGSTRVAETDDQGYRVRRRRECKSCGERFTTMEWRVEKSFTRHSYSRRWERRGHR